MPEGGRYCDSDPTDPITIIRGGAPGWQRQVGAWLLDVWRPRAWEEGSGVEPMLYAYPDLICWLVGCRESGYQDLPMGVPARWVLDQELECGHTSRGLPSLSPEGLPS